jgi:hypothetical protein
VLGWELMSDDIEERSGGSPVKSPEEGDVEKAVVPQVAEQPVVPAHVETAKSGFRLPSWVTPALIITVIVGIGTWTNSYHNVFYVRRSASIFTRTIIIGPQKTNFEVLISNTGNRPIIVNAIDVRYWYEERRSSPFQFNRDNPMRGVLDVPRPVKPGDPLVFTTTVPTNLKEMYERSTFMFGPYRTIYAGAQLEINDDVGKLSLISYITSRFTLFRDDSTGVVSMADFASAPRQTLDALGISQLASVSEFEKRRAQWEIDRKEHERIHPWVKRPKP